MPPKKFHVPADHMRVELDAIKDRQKDRKQAEAPEKVTNEMLYEMLFDVIENQARIENALNKLLAR
jgi:hypothetical protein